MGGLSNRATWKPRARWIKFEEDWEDGAERWGKPHVASLTFNSLPQLRKLLENGKTAVQEAHYYIILCPSSRTTVTSARITEDDAYQTLSTRV